MEELIQDLHPIAEFFAEFAGFEQFTRSSAELQLINSIVQVPRSKNIQRHAISGEGRVNLTFRRLKLEWAARAPQCRCNQRSVMRCSNSRSKIKKNSLLLKAGSGTTSASGSSSPSTHTLEGSAAVPRYYYACDNTQGPGCGFWQELLLPHAPDSSRQDILP